MKWTLNPDPGEKAKMIAALEKHLNKGAGPASPTVGEPTNTGRNLKTGKHLPQVFDDFQILLGSRK